MKNFDERTDSVIKKADRLQKYGNTGYKTPVMRNTRLIKRISAIAASAAAVVILNLVLFIPFRGATGSVAAYKNSEYYGLIKVVNDLTFTPPEYKNNFEVLMGKLNDMFALKGSNDMSGGSVDLDPMPDAPSSGEQYVENTNNQVSGVIEGDLLKRSTTHAYYLSLDSGYNNLYLYVYTINGAQSERAATYLIETDENCYTSPEYYFGAETYLSADCKTITVINSFYSYGTKKLYTRVLSIDVSNLENVHEASRTYLSGEYVSSRMLNGELYVFTNTTVNSNPDFSDEKQFLPQSGGSLDDMRSVAPDDIVYPENASSARYTVVSKFADGELCDNVAFLSYSTEAYASVENIYLTHDYSKGGVSKTDIARVGYGDGLEYKNAYTIDGTVNDQFSLDEKDGALRVVTTVNAPVTNASLYIINIESGEFIARHERFAPDGERVFSVRFDGDIAYVCTALRNEITWEFSDPVYKIDLSDPQNITSKDTGEIEGYSSTLIKFKDGLLLGIGSTNGLTSVNGWIMPTEGLKIELYTETEDGLESYAQYTHSGRFATEFKSYYIDAERGLIGIAIEEHTSDEFVKYILLLFDGYNFIEVETVNLEDCYTNTVRAFYEDGNIYVYHHYDNYVIELNK